MTPLLGISDVSRIFGVSDDTIRRLVHKGELACSRIGGKMKFEQGDIEAFIAEHKTGQRRQTVAQIRAARG